MYKNQGYIEKLSEKTGIASYRLSEQRQILFGNRGSKYDEHVYLRGVNTDAETVNTKPSGSWMKFALNNSSVGSRYDEVFHTFTQAGSFP